MPLPFLIGGVAAVAGIIGVGTGIHGGMQVKEANDTINAAQYKKEKAEKKYKAHSNETTKQMDKLGKYELEILSSFEYFSDLIEKIQGRPEFKEISIKGVELPKYKAQELKDVSIGAGALLGGIGGAAAGTAGGFAAAGATTSAVMALGAASTGTAISTLSGVAATNATLAAIGGGAISAGGGGMALGSAILGGATLGVGLLVGGVIFNITGNKLSSQADEAWEQAKKIENEVEKIVEYLSELKDIASNYFSTLEKVNEQYRLRLGILESIVVFYERTEWSKFTEKEKDMVEELIMLVGLLYKMCKIKLVLQSSNENELNKVNKTETQKMIYTAEEALSNSIS